MSDLISLALAAAMPLAVFVAYALIRAWLDARARRPSRAGRGRQSRTAPAEPRVVRMATVQPSMGSDPARGMIEKLPVSRPALDSPGNGRYPPVTTTPLRASSSRREEWSSDDASGLPRLRDQGSIPGGSRLPARPVASSNPVPDPSLGGPRLDGAGPGPRVDPSVTSARPGHGLLSNPLKPIRTMLGQGARDRRPVEPHWPEPDQTNGSIKLFDDVVEASEPCPVCAESRERGARFCRRCGRAVDLPSTTVSMPVMSSAIPLPTPTAEPLAGELAAPDAHPAIARPPVVRPAQYVPAAAPVATPVAVPVAAASPGAKRSTPRTAARRARAKGQPAEPAAALLVKLPVARHAQRPGARENGATAAPPTDTPEDSVGSSTTGERVDLNRATAAQLAALRGVGRRTAQRIIAAREDRAFATIDALADRKIMGRSALEKLRDQVTVAP
jgi:competence ComEA-like helix-hairpin-helix protein